MRFRIPGNLFCQVWRRFEIPVGIRHVSVAQKGTEKDDVLSHCLCLGRAPLERANSKGVSQIVEGYPTFDLSPVGDTNLLTGGGK